MKEVSQATTKILVDLSTISCDCKITQFKVKDGEVYCNHGLINSDKIKLETGDGNKPTV